MNRAPTCLLFAAAVLLAACATPSAYAPAARAGAAGFTDTRIEADRYRVSYRGTSADPGQKVQDFALLHASDITLQQGYDWFVVDRREEEAGADSRPQLSFGIGGASFGGHTGVGVGVGTSVPLGAPRDDTRAVTLDIRLGHGAKPADPNAYDAREVQTAVHARM